MKYLLPLLMLLTDCTLGEPGYVHEKENAPYTLHQHLYGMHHLHDVQGVKPGVGR